MAIFQVVRVGAVFGVLMDGSVVGTRPTRGAAVKLALHLKEQHS